MARRQGDRLCVAVYELAFLVLKVDPGSNPKAELLDPTSSGSSGGVLLGGLHRATLSLLRTLFKRYPSHRPAMIQEMLPILCQVYGAKTITRSYPLHRSVHLGQAKVIITFIISTHPVNAPSHNTLSKYPLNTYYQHTLSILHITHSSSLHSSSQYSPSLPSPPLSFPPLPY